MPIRSIKISCLQVDPIHLQLELESPQAGPRAGPQAQQKDRAQKIGRKSCIYVPW